MSILRSAARGGGRGAFKDRRDAGMQLARLLRARRDERPVVVALPRGGVPVAAEVARVLQAPLDVLVVCKIGAPRNPEYAIGALAEGGVRLLSERAARALGLSKVEREASIARGERELQERIARYRAGRASVELSGRTVILVDDGLATGRSALAAVRALRARGVARVVLASPVSSRQAARMLAEEADEVVCVEVPETLRAVGLAYRDFRPTSDAELATLLEPSLKAKIDV